PGLLTPWVNFLIFISGLIQLGLFFPAKNLQTNIFFKKIALILVLDNSICINLAYTDHFPVL
ncbi:hypothetical protein, partial [Leptospira interrogans]